MLWEFLFLYSIPVILYIFFEVIEESMIIIHVMDNEFLLVLLSLWLWI